MTNAYIAVIAERFNRMSPEAFKGPSGAIQEYLGGYAIRRIKEHNIERQSGSKDIRL